MTSSPTTRAPTTVAQHQDQAGWFLVVMVSIIAGMLIAMVVVITFWHIRSRTRMWHIQMQRLELQTQQALAAGASDADIAAMRARFNKLRDQGRGVTIGIGENLVAPALDSDDAQLLGEFLFHWSTGRSLLLSYIQINLLIAAGLTIIVSQLLNYYIINYIIAVATNPMYTATMAISLTTTLLVVHQVASQSMQVSMDHRLGERTMFYDPVEKKTN